ncbi:MAG: sugar ABC transporter substrate-binding protein [Solirubrobacteraceae bacterium]
MEDRKSQELDALNMMKSRRELLKAGALMGLGLTALPLVGCGSSSSASSASTGASSGAASSAKHLDGMSHYIANVTSLESADRGFQFAIEKLGGKFNHQSYDGDQQKLLSQVQTFPTLGVNGVTSYIVADSVVPRYAQILSSQKVSYVNFANRIPWFTPAEDKFNGYFLTTFNGSFGEEGYVVSKLLFQKGGGKGDAIMLGGVKGGASDNARTFGVQTALKEFPGVNVVAHVYTDWDTTKAQQALQTLLPAHTGVKFIIAMNDSIAVGALAALRAAGNHDALVMGVDGDPAFLKEMVNDKRVVATAAGRLDHTGVIAAVTMFDFLNGVKLNPLESIRNTDSVVVDTPAAAQAMLNLIGQAPGPLPYDPVKMSRHLSGNNWELPHRVEVADPANFDWGNKPGVNKTPKPAGFAWPDAYQKALDAGDLDKLNADYQTRFKDVYGPVRAKAHYKQDVLGTFQKLGIA